MHRWQQRHLRDGFALLVVLLVIAILALSAYTFSDLMTTENQSVQLHGRQLQARALVDSGVAQIRYVLELDELTRQDWGGVYHNPSVFQAQLVLDHGAPAGRGRFSVVAPEQDMLGFAGGWRFGLEDESSRLNVNLLTLDFGGGASSMDPTAAEDRDGGPSNGSSGAITGDGQDASEQAKDDALDPMDISGTAMLMKLPGMTADIADAILDWIDEDDEPRTYGAEAEYYGMLDPPYAPRNGPLETVEELLLVRGVTPPLLFGRDINRNGLIDLHEEYLPIVIDGDPGDGSMDCGWAAHLTLYSREKNVTADGEPRINLNDDDLERLYDELSIRLNESWAIFIVAYRQNGPYQGDSETTEPAGEQSLDLNREGSKKLNQVLDLIGVRVEAQLQDGETVVLECPFPDDALLMASYLPELMENCTVQPNPEIPGRININQASRTVLLTIPGMTSDLADVIITQRDPANAENDSELQHETWILTRGIVTLDEMRQLIPFVTAGGDVYRAQVIGYFDKGEMFSRAEVVVDGTKALPRVLLWRDLTHLGRGFTRESLGIDVTPH